MHGIHFAITPVADVESVLILRRELRAIAKGHAGGRTGADIHHGRQAVLPAHREFLAARAPAELAAALHEAHASRAIPGHPGVPLHVRVKAEDVAAAVHGDVVGVARAGVHQLPLLAIQIRLRQPAARGQDIAHEAAAQQHGVKLVFRPVARNQARLAARLGRLVATHHIQALAILGGNDAMRTVLTGFARKGAQQLHGVELVITIGVLAAVKATTLISIVIHHAIKCSGMIQQPLTVTEVDAELFHLRLTGAAIQRRRGDAVERAILVAANHAPLVVLRHGHPGAFLLLRYRVQQLHLEAFGDLDLVSRCCLTGQLSERRRRAEQQRNENGFHGWIMTKLAVLLRTTS